MTTMTMRHHLAIWACVTWAAAAALPAQGRDPMHEIQELARSVDEQLQEIDRLLMESGKQSQTRERPQQLLEQASERSATARDGIDQLIEKLTEMKNRSSSESGSGEGEGQPGQGSGQQPQPQGAPKNRRENETPDFVQQPKPEPGAPGQQPKPGQEQPGEGQPQGAQQTDDPAENRTGNRPPESETGPPQRGQGDETWGELQPYVNFLKNRGSSPKVPEKYRKYWEAYLKGKQGSGGR